MAKNTTTISLFLVVVVVVVTLLFLRLELCFGLLSPSSPSLLKTRKIRTKAARIRMHSSNLFGFTTTTTTTTATTTTTTTTTRRRQQQQQQPRNHNNKHDWIPVRFVSRQAEKQQQPRLHHRSIFCRLHAAEGSSDYNDNNNNNIVCYDNSSSGSGSNEHNHNSDNSDSCSTTTSRSTNNKNNDDTNVVGVDTDATTLTTTTTRKISNKSGTARIGGRSYFSRNVRNNNNSNNPLEVVDDNMDRNNNNKIISVGSISNLPSFWTGVVVGPLMAILLWLLLQITSLLAGTKDDKHFVYYERSVYESRTFGADGKVETTSRQERIRSNLPSLVDDDGKQLLQQEQIQSNNNNPPTTTMFKLQDDDDEDDEWFEREMQTLRQIQKSFLFNNDFF